MNLFKSKWFRITLVAFLGVNTVIALYLAYSSMKWKSGFYLTDLDVSISANLSPCVLTTSAIYVGKLSEEELENIVGICTLSNGPDVTYGTVSVGYVKKEDGYTLINLDMTTEIILGAHTYKELELQLGDSIFTKDVNIEFIGSDASNPEGVTASADYMDYDPSAGEFGLRLEINNETEQALTITGPNAYFTSHDTEFSVINDATKTQWGLSDVTALNFPYTIEAGKDAFLYVKVSYSEPTPSTLCYGMPYFEANIGEEPTKIYFTLDTSCPTLSLSQEAALEIIKEAKE